MRNRDRIGRFAIYALAFLGLGLAHWIHDNFGNPSIEQIVYHLRFSEGLAGEAGGTFLVTFIVECVVKPMLFASAVLLGERYLQALARISDGASRVWRVLASWFRRLPAVALAVSALTLMTQLSAGAYIRSTLGRDFFSQNYIDPSSVVLSPRKPKNLLLIYVEGFEETYGDETLFGKNLLQDLKSLGGTRFSQYRSAPGATWTMGGIVSTQCGIPLKVMSLLDLPEADEHLKSFLPGAVCLGDVLQRFGYRNVFMGGARLAFAGKGRFLADHGYQEIYGKREWLQRGVGFGDMNYWGLYDDDLLERAKSKLRELHASGSRFNLTLLTLDTHHPSGFYSKRCKQDGADNFQGIVECTAKQVAEFVRFARTNGLLENTNVVIVGDHLAAPNPLYDRLKAVPHRTIFNDFISDEPIAKATENLLPFDLYPSILHFIGIDVVGGRLGLGYVAFSGTPVGRSQGELDTLLSDVLNPSDTYLKLWRPLPARR